MNTYVLRAPVYARVDLWIDDCQHFFAPTLNHALVIGSDMWQCGPEDITLLAAFEGQCKGILHTKLSKP